MIEDLRKANITIKDILKFCYVVGITSMAITLLFICIMANVF